MSIATQPETRLDPKVLHPLERLRGTIRRYVVIEGLLSAAIFVAAWCAVGLALDFGLFKLFTWDWALDAPAGLRWAALILSALLLLAVVVFRIVVRLSKELSFPALALVLERKFPKILGDRLITAVELADVERQQRYGYSSAMIRQTIEEARERVGTVPVNDVFNWKRLRNMAALAIGLLVGIVATGFIAFAVGNKSADPVRFGWRFAHVGTTFLERDLLVRNVPWPRRAHLELVGFPESGDLRIGKDAGEPTVRVKAFRWVIADRSARMGWRPLRMNDLSAVGASAPDLPVEAFTTAGEGELGDDPKSWDVDRIQAVGSEDKDARERLMKLLDAAGYEQVQKDLDDLFAKLDAKAADPAMGRTLRKLEVPAATALHYGGATKTGEVTLEPLKNREFASRIADLKESVFFTVRAEDFRTESKKITLVPPPAFVSLSRIEMQPAYLLHTPPEFNYALLKGRRQLMPEKKLSLTGDRTAFSVDSGTELELIAKFDTDLTGAHLLPKVGVLPEAVPGSAAPLPIAVDADGRTVRVKFEGDHRLAAGRTFMHWYWDVDRLAAEPVTSQSTYEFDLVVEQADKVQAKRQIMIQVVEDQPPVVEIAPDVIRKIGNVYYVTPKAKIPFNPESYIRDDHGLSKVAYEYSYWSEDSDIGRALRAQLATRAFLYSAGPPSIPSGVAVAFHTAKFKDLDKGDQRQNGSAEVGRFITERSDLSYETLDRLTDILSKPFQENPAKKQVVNKIDLKNQTEDIFDIGRLKLLASASEVQTRYRLDLNIVATDANSDTGPRSGQNAEPIRLLIVSEGDLLAEINKEEETFANRLDEGLAKIKVAKSRLAVSRGFFGQPDRIEDARVKMQDAAQEVVKVHDILSTLVREYRRIYRECQVNEVKDTTRDYFGKFANEMDRLCGETPAPVAADEDKTPPSMTFAEVERRMDIITNTLNGNRWGDVQAFGAAEIGLLDLERLLQVLRDKLGEVRTKEKLRLELERVIAEQDRIGKELRELNDRYQRLLLSKDPEIGKVAATFLGKGEVKKMRHAINWRQYDKDDLAVKLTAVDKDKKPVPPEALGFPTELKLNFEKHQLEFEYDLKGGSKEGEFTLTLTPAVGEPVSVTVTVR